MNKDNAKHFLPLVQALVDGKMIQYSPGNNNEWVDMVSPSFKAPTNRYRIKPEPREWFLNVYPTGGAYGHETLSEAQKDAGKNTRTIRVREILD